VAAAMLPGDAGQAWGTRTSRLSRSWCCSTWQAPLNVV